MSLIEISNKPISITKNSTVSDAIRILLDTKKSRLLVTESSKFTGIITEKDIGFFLFSETTKKGLDDIPISQILKQIKFIKGDESPQNAAKLMIENGISSLAIGNQDGLKGIFTKTDLIRYYENSSDERKVVDYMTHDFVFSHTAAPLYKIIKKMLENNISRIIIKNQKEEAVGIISFRDLFRISLELGSEEDYSGFSLPGQIRRGFLSEDGFGYTTLARDVMSRGLITIKFNEGLQAACNLILKNNVSGLVVLDGNNGLAGIISKTDIIKAIANS